MASSPYIFFIIQIRLTRTVNLLCQKASPWNIIYNIGINIITGHSFNGFRIPNYWGEFPYGCPFSCQRENV